MNKLQIRAELLNAIKLIDSGDKHSPEFLQSIISPLLKIEDKALILDILIKEIISAKNDSRFLNLSYILENVIPKDMLESQLWKLLNSAEIDDRTKANIINILKDLGNQINYEKYIEYFENPDSVIDSDTERMLKSAIYNPEALIDFLDFIEALPPNDRSILVDSLCEDYEGDELANLFIPVIYANPNSELCKYAIKRLGDSKSPLALRPLNWIAEYSKDSETQALAKKSLSMLKLAGARYDKTEEFFESVLKNTELQEVFVSMPDGHGNIGILAIRKRLEKDSFQIMAAVFNDTSGIIDCFGFNELTKNEYSRIVDKFYSNQAKILLEPSIAKLLLDNAEKTSLDSDGKISYEYICWKRILQDIRLPANDVKVELSANLNKIPVTIEDLKKIYTTTLFDKWFLDSNDDEEFHNLLNEITALLSEQISLEKAFNEIEDAILMKYSKIWRPESIEKIDYRLLLSAYLLSIRGLSEHADILYSIIYNCEVKTEMLMNIIRVSVYEFLLRERGKYQNSIISTNIFSRRNEANKAVLDKKTIEAVIKELEDRWKI